MTNNNSAPGRMIIDAFPPDCPIEGISISAFKNSESFFQRMLYEVEHPDSRILSYLNIHVANLAYRNKQLKKFLQQSNCIYCDGDGIRLGAALLGGHIPCRFPAADWFMGFFRFMAQYDKTIFLLGGKPGVPERMLALLNHQVPGHTVVGVHHGYIHHDKLLERWALRQIHHSQPDILIVGFGTPLQEFWIKNHDKDLENIPMILPLGAVMDYFTGEETRCPQWMGNFGLEWLYRLSQKPGRMFKRYIVGNPWFFYRLLLSRIVMQSGGISQAKSDDSRIYPAK